MKLKATYFALLMALFGFASRVFAQGAGGDVTGNNGSTTSFGAGLENPLGPNNSTLLSFVEKVLNIVITIGIPVIALFIIYSGFLFVRAQGDTKKIEEARQTLLYTVIGAAIILGSWVLAQAICGTVAELGNTIPQCKP